MKTIRFGEAEKGNFEIAFDHEERYDTLLYVPDIDEYLKAGAAVDSDIAEQENYRKFDKAFV